MSTCETNVVEQTTEGTCCYESSVCELFYQKWRQAVCDFAYQKWRQAIREFAYQKWRQAGEPGGDGINFWLDAENELADEWTNAMTYDDYVEVEVAED